MNDQQTHTPGPWFHVNGNEIHDREAFFDESGARVGSTPNLIASTSFPNKEANARLIAAAPDLLDACDFAVTILKGMGNGNGDAANACRAAIAKARGEA